MPTLNLQDYEEIKGIEPGETVLDILQKNEISINSICGGKQTCGKCKIVILENPENLSQMTEQEDKLLSQSEKKENVRLACATRLYGDVKIKIMEEAKKRYVNILSNGESFAIENNPAYRKQKISLDSPSLKDPIADIDRVIRFLKPLYGDLSLKNLEILKKTPKNLRKNNWNSTVVLRKNKDIVDIVGDEKIFGLVFDIGTSTIVGKLINLTTGREVETVARENSQQDYGEDIITRITRAKKEYDELKETLDNQIDSMAKKLYKKSGIEGNKVYEIVFVGNTVMHHLFLGLDISNLGKAPYVPVVSTDIELSPANFNFHINPEGNIYSPPLIGGFIGSDISAGILASRIYQSENPMGFIDIGTNCEIVLSDGEAMKACSAPAGPVFEGGEISQGTTAKSGAICSFSIDKEEFIYTTIDDKAPFGICGSGLLDIVASLLDNEFLTNHGHLQGEHDRIDHERKEFVLVREGESLTGSEIKISESDISQFIMAKAAIRTGIEVLMDSFSIKKLEGLYIGGGFGNTVNPKSALRTGLIPQSVNNIINIGNSAIKGGKNILLSTKARQSVKDLKEKIEYVELKTVSGFQEKYTENLNLQ